MIIEYSNKYIEDARDLLDELEEYLISIDKDKLDMRHEEYRKKMFLKELREISKKNGKCYLYIEKEKVVGLIMGIITEYGKYDYLDYKCPKRGEIIELIVTNKARKIGIGKALIKKMENYFKLNGCEYVIVDVFAYNEIGKCFYKKNDYHTRMETMIKKI